MSVYVIDDLYEDILVAAEDNSSAGVLPCRRYACAHAGVDVCGAAYFLRPVISAIS